eukprot:Protomagalhaensia_sp_Gyna_25__1920@NODE_2019_length_1343_cov_7_514571_g1665_i0_p1_GENE_NODE_2019_length_1343_cov_7_514571_g1665_i0NODE_2019_length_1343_cov_7_514571_g1665_i0_p1_ORF_typecomplete_len318_score26_29RabGAPTBC/PF00566_18/2_3e21_NODE_2019_length_1343_cov_7_514571_g1665_i040993
MALRKSAISPQALEPCFVWRRAAVLPQVYGLLGHVSSCADRVATNMPKRHSERRSTVMLLIHGLGLLVRTFSNHPAFRNTGISHSNHQRLSQGQERLKRVLFASLAAAPRPVEYCQGLNYLAAVFLTVFSADERAASEGFLHFLFETDVFTRFDGAFRTVQDLCQDLNSFCSVYCPRLRHLLTAYEISLQVYSFTWILLFFVYNVQGQIELLDVVLTIWDHMLLHGLAIILATSKFLVKLLDGHLSQQMDPTYEEFVNLLREWPATVFSKYRGEGKTGQFLEDVTTFQANTYKQAPSIPDNQRPKSHHLFFRVCRGA